MTSTIAIDVRALSIPEKASRGTGQVIRPLLAALARFDSKTDFLLLTAPGQSLDLPGPNFRSVEVPGEYGDISREHWHAKSVRTGRFLNDLAPDLYHSPDLYFPRGFRGPVIVTAYDCFDFPLFGGFTMFGKRYGWRWNFRFRLRYAWTWRTLGIRAARIATISRTTAARIAEYHPRLADKLRPIPLGLDDEWFSLPVENGIAERLSLSRPILLHTGGFENRKNPEGILAAFRHVRERHPTATLALTGPPHGTRPDEPGIRYLGYLLRAELKSLYAAADCFLYPSFEEGFGIPVLEALSQGCPVVTSRGTATEEAARGEAILVNPCEHAEISEAALEALRMGRRAASRTRTFDDVARDYLALYHEVLGGSR